MTRESSKEIQEDLSAKLALAKKIDEEFLSEKFKVERLIREIFSSIEKHSHELKNLQEVFPDTSNKKLPNI